MAGRGFASEQQRPLDDEYFPQTMAKLVNVTFVCEPFHVIETNPFYTQIRGTNALQLY